MITTIQINSTSYIEIPIHENSTGKLVGYVISKGLHLKESDPEYNRDYDSAIDGLESLILGLACAGVDISTEQFKEGVISAVDAISNNY